MSFIIYFLPIYDSDFSFLAGVYFLIQELISKPYAQVMTFVLVQFWPISLDICAITAFDGVPSKFDAKTKWKYSHPLKGLFLDKDWCKSIFCKTWYYIFIIKTTFSLTTSFLPFLFHFFLQKGLSCKIQVNYYDVCRAPQKSKTKVL